MENLNIEKFLFNCDILYCSENENSENIYLPLKLLFSMSCLYFYSHDPKNIFSTTLKDYNNNNENSSDRSKFSLNSSNNSYKKNFKYLIIIKLNHYEVFITDYDFNNNSVEYKVIHPLTFNNKNISNINNPFIYNEYHKFILKANNYNNAFDIKNYIRIMMIIDGYKYSIKNSVLIERDNNNMNNNINNNEINNETNNNNNIENKSIISSNINNENNSNLNQDSRNNIIFKEKNKSQKNILLFSNYINSEYLYNLLNNLILNNFKLIITPSFFDEDPKLLKEFTSFLCIIRYLKIDCILYEEEDPSSNINENINNNNTNINNNNTEESYLTAFSDRFNLEKASTNNQNPNSIYEKKAAFISMKSIRNTFQQGGTLRQKKPFMNIYFFEYIDLSHTYLNDKGFSKVIINLIEKCPNLIELNLSHNLLTNIVFIKLYESQNNYLKIIDLSYNKIKTENLFSDLRYIVTNFLSIRKLSLKGNLIRNMALKKFNPLQFDSLLGEIKNKINERKDDTDYNYKINNNINNNNNNNNNNKEENSLIISNSKLSSEISHRKDYTNLEESKQQKTKRSKRNSNLNINNNFNPKKSTFKQENESFINKNLQTLDDKNTIDENDEETKEEETSKTYTEIKTNILSKIPTILIIFITLNLYFITTILNLFNYSSHLKEIISDEKLTNIRIKTLNDIILSINMIIIYRNESILGENNSFNNYMFTSLNTEENFREIMKHISKESDIYKTILTYDSNNPCEYFNGLGIDYNNVLNCKDFMIENGLSFQISNIINQLVEINIRLNSHLKNNEIDSIIEMFFEDVLINIMIQNIFFIRLFLSDISTIYYNNYISRISNFIQVIHFKLAIFLIVVVVYIVFYRFIFVEKMKEKLNNYSRIKIFFDDEYFRIVN